MNCGYTSKKTASLIVATAIFCLVSIYSPVIAVYLSFALIFIFFFFEKPILSLAAVICILPFANMGLFGQQIAGIPGAKIPNLLIVAAFFVFMFSKESFELQKSELIFLVGLILLLIFGVARSLPHLREINYTLDPKLGEAKYILTYLVRPIFYLVPFFIIGAYIKKYEEVSFLVNVLAYSMCFFSLFLVGYYIMEVPDKTNFISARHIIMKKFNMHVNDLINFYILSYPIMLSNFFRRKKVIDLLILLISLFGVVILYSRTGYVLIVFSTLLFVCLTKNKKWLPVLVLIGLVVVFLFPADISGRSKLGLEGGSFDDISTGRIEGIWKPLIVEYMESPVKLLVGNGTNAIVYSKAYKRQYVLQVGHAHNMYLNAILEVGLIGLSFLVYILFYYVKRVNNAIGDQNNKYFYISSGVFVSLIVYLISGFSGRDLFPGIENSYLYIVLGIGAFIIKEANSNVYSA